ncbi:MAG: cytochrome C [Nitrospirota bacterium]
MRTMTIRLIVLLLLPVLVLTVYATLTQAGTVVKHPVEVEVPVICSECHQDWRSSMDHTAEFGKFRHRFVAAQNKQSCGICHAESFCSDCHAHKEVLKPGEKFKDAPERAIPHRGDYLNQHKIDGKINPASCVRCHGRQNNERCRTCHR